jgi:hypothetical protein
MSEFIPTEKGVPIRQPSTANLMIDSQDRTASSSYPSNFIISKNNSILNGFFTRLGVTEVVLEWFQPNITGDSRIFEFEESGGSTTLSVTIPAGFYTVASALQAMAAGMTTASAGAGGQTRTYTASGSNGTGRITTSSGTFDFIAGVVYNSVKDQLGMNGTAAAFQAVGQDITNDTGNGWTPDLRAYRYIDFTSSSLTYNQELKDASTGQSVDNILARWYFAWDSQSPLDSYGFPILQGYTSFTERRIFNPPKQIKWSPNQPIGQLQFNVTATNDLTNMLPQNLPSTTAFDFLMTLQVSEV